MSSQVDASERGIGPMPPIHRSSMAEQAWAGHPLWRPVRRLLKRQPPQTWETDPIERPLMWRRALLLVLVALGAILGTDYMIDIMPQHGDDWAERGLLVLFAILFAWVSAGFWTAVLGAWVMLRRGDRRSVTRVLRGEGATAPIAPEARTAIIMPICNEDVPTVFAGLRATCESLAGTDSAERFDFFVLSDTNDPDARVAEQVAWARLTDALRQAGHAVHVYYRWRQHRTHRKAGNVADFCRRFGADYRYMIVLDADSVMSGNCLVSLVRMMPASSRPPRARPATRPSTPASCSSARGSTARCSRPACTTGSWASRTTGGTTRSCAWLRSSSIAHCRRCRARPRCRAA